MTTTVPAGPDTSGVTTAVVDLPDRPQLLRIIAEAVAGGLPAPQSIDLLLHSTGNRSLDLRMDNNRADQVDAWARAVAPDVDASALLSHTLFYSPNRPWRSYNYETSWHGWVLYVWSAVNEPEHPAPGTTIPDQAPVEA